MVDRSVRLIWIPAWKDLNERIARATHSFVVPEAIVAEVSNYSFTFFSPKCKTQEIVKYAYKIHCKALLYARAQKEELFNGCADKIKTKNE